MKKLLLCLLAITAAISTAWAQTPKKNIFGLRVGMDMSKISILDTGSGEKYLSELRTSFNIGLTDQVRLLNDKPFYFQFGLMLHNKGGKVQATDGGSDIELSAADYPQTTPQRLSSAAPHPSQLPHPARPESRCHSFRRILRIAGCGRQTVL